MLLNSVAHQRICDAAGCDVVTVQHALGHSWPSIMLNTYSHLRPKAEDRTRKAAAGPMSIVFPEKTKILRTLCGLAAPTRNLTCASASSQR